MIPLYEGVIRDIITTHPTYAVITLGILGICGLVIWKISPGYFDKKNCESRCKALTEKINELEATVQLLSKENKNYLQLKGAVTVMRKKLMELGFEDIPGLD